MVPGYTGGADMAAFPAARAVGQGGAYDALLPVNLDLILTGDVVEQMPAAGLYCPTDFIFHGAAHHVRSRISPQVVVGSKWTSSPLMDWLVF